MLPTTGRDLQTLTPFFRADTSRTTGMGLGIIGARRLMDHSASIAARPRYDRIASEDSSPKRAAEADPSGPAAIADEIARAAQTTPTRSSTFRAAN